MRRSVRSHRDVPQPQSPAQAEGAWRDCPKCRAENAVFVPADFHGARHKGVTLVAGRDIAGAQQVVCRHCRTSLTVVGMTGAESAAAEQTPSAGRFGTARQ